MNRFKILRITGLAATKMISSFETLYMVTICIIITSLVLPAEILALGTFPKHVFRTVSLASLQSAVSLSPCPLPRLKERKEQKYSRRCCNQCKCLSLYPSFYQVCYWVATLEGDHFGERSPWAEATLWETTIVEGENILKKHNTLI